MIVYVVMKQTKPRFTESQAFIQFIYKDEEKAKAFVKMAIAADPNSFYFIDDREIEE